MVSKVLITGILGVFLVGCKMTEDKAMISFRPQVEDAKGTESTLAGPLSLLQARSNERPIHEAKTHNGSKQVTCSLKAPSVEPVSCVCAPPVEVPVALAPIIINSPRDLAAHLSTTSFEKPSSLVLEYGVSVGFPSLINLSLASWGTKELPLLVKVSGFYLGNTRGIQVEAGWAFHRTDQIRQYIGLQAVSFDWDFNLDLMGNSFKRFGASGIGPTYGISAFGIAAQFGLYYGSYRLNFRNPLESVSFNFQLGWSQIW